MICSHCGADHSPNAQSYGTCMAPVPMGAPVTAARANRPLGLLAAVGLTAMLVGGAAIPVAAKAPNKSNNVPRASAASFTSVANLLPASTVLFASFNPNPGGDQGANLRTIESAFGGQSLFNTISKLSASTSTSSCSDVSKQILSWVAGPITLAITDPAALKSSKSSKASAKGVAVLGAVKPGLSVSGVMTKNHLGTAVPAGTYAGVSIYSLKPASGCMSNAVGSSPTYAAIVNNVAIIAGVQTEIQREIKVAQGKAPALSSSAAYKNIIAKLPPTGIAYMYLDLPAIVKATSGAAAGALSGSGSPLGALSGSAGSGSQVANQLGAAGVSLVAQANGLDLQAVAVSKAPIPNASATTPNHGASVLPQGSIFYLSMGNLKGLINGVLDAVSSGSPTSNQQMAQLRMVFGNVLNLLDGEFALGVLPIRPASLSKLGANDTTGLPLAVLFNVSKHPDAGSTISTVLTALGSSLGLSFKPSKSPHGNTEFTAKGGYGYAILKGWLLISTSIKNVTKSVESVLYGGAPSLASGSSYKLGMTSAGKLNASVMFFDIGQLRTTLEKLILPSSTAADRAQYAKIRPLLVPFRAITLSTGMENGGKVVRANMLLVISK
ncbi:MAG: hypothetical protein JWO42_726 [Chloroflexi bacterium]|nr:hypothetical protein [Chloroflexota bacterium]